MSGEVLKQAHVAEDLLSYLYSQYERAVKKCESDGNKAELLDGAKQFYEFAQSFLTDVRPRGTYVVEDNAGILLSNNIRVTVSPGDPEAVHGTMAPVIGQAVSPVADSKATMSTYMSQGAVPISGFVRPPKNSMDYSDTYSSRNYKLQQAKGRNVVDKTETTQHKQYNTKAPVVTDPFNS